MSLILASKSVARQSMLKNTSVEFQAIPAELNEEKIIQDLEEHGASATNICLSLAKEKALYISAQHNKSYIIGSDQVLTLDDKIYSKAQNKEEAIDRLLELQGKEHFLTSAVCVAKNNEILWHKTDAVALRMKKMDRVEIENYADKAGEILTSCVGAYAIEGLGIRLFDDIRGDYFTIMGMPLLPLLNYLGEEGAI